MPDTKTRMIHAAAESLRRRGVAGTSFTEVLAAAEAPRGVIYHHFPAGKGELARAAVAWTGERVATQLEQLEPAEPTARGVVLAFLELVRPVVADSAGGAGCAVAAGVAEEAPDSELQLVSRAALRRWRTALAGRLEAVGVEAEEAAGLAAALLAVLEGSHVLCRAEGTLEPFDALRPVALRLAG